MFSLIINISVTKQKTDLINIKAVRQETFHFYLDWKQISFNLQLHSAHKWFM